MYTAPFQGLVVLAYKVGLFLYHMTSLGQMPLLTRQMTGMDGRLGQRELNPARSSWMRGHHHFAVADPQ